MLRGVKCIRGYIEMDEHMRCQAQEAGPPCLISPTILQKIVQPNQERIDAGVIFSPSSIASCHRQSVLSKDNDYYVDVRQGYKATRGTIFHQGLSKEPAYPGTLGVVRELRMKASINTRYGEQVFHGQPDEVVLLGVTEQKILAPNEQQVVGWTGETRNILHVKLVDYKTKSEVGHDLISSDPRNVHQINEYAWLVTKFLPDYLNNCTGHGDPGGC